MTSSERDHSIDAEPHLRKDAFTPDRAEDAVTRRMAAERVNQDPDAERARHSVFDEPATLPNRLSVLIDRDWSCRNCGYNLRGLMTGHACPECGRVERYEPPRAGEVTYLEWLASQEGRISPGGAWLVAVAMALLGALPALPAALMLAEYTGLLNFVVIGPLVAEIVKVVVVAMLIERRSPLLRSRSQIYFMALGSAVVFTIVQNLVILKLYIPTAADLLVAYRWVFCVFLHVGCTMVVVRGLVPIWERIRDERKAVALSEAGPGLLAAVVLHGMYNACVFFQGQFGFGF